jgi:hypothetical protein
LRGSQRDERHFVVPWWWSSPLVVGRLEAALHGQREKLIGDVYFTGG